MDQLLQVRVSEEMKREATELFEDLGMDLSTAIRVFLRACIKEGGIPFKMKRTVSKQVEEAAEKAIQEMNEISRQNGNCNMTLDEINEEIRLAREELNKR